MSDNKRKRGRQDRSKVARLQVHEVRYIADKFKVPVKWVRDAVKFFGNSRRKIYAEIRARKKYGW